MPNDPNDDPTPDPKGGDGKTFTQADVDRIVQERLAREKAKVPDNLDELKAKAAKFDEVEEANQSDLDKAQQRLAEVEAKATKAEHDLLVERTARKHNLPEALASRLQGSNADELEEDAAALAEQFVQPAGGTQPPPSGRPTAHPRGGNDPTEEPEPDVDKVVESIPRGI